MGTLQNRNWATIFIAILGAVKLILQAFGIHIITNQQVDAIANGLAALVTVIGVIMTHMKRGSGASTSGGASSSGGIPAQPEPKSQPNSAPPQNLVSPGPPAPGAGNTNSNEQPPNHQT